MVQLRVLLELPTGPVVLLRGVVDACTVGELIDGILAEQKLSGVWEIVLGTEILPRDRILSDLASGSDPLELRLRPVSLAEQSFGSRDEFSASAPEAERTPPPADIPAPQRAPAPVVPGTVAEPSLRARSEAMPTLVRAKAKTAAGRLDSLDVQYAAPPTEQRATVRYYARMNPQRVFPLLVILSPEEIERIQQANVEQRTSDRFAVDESAPVEIEPVLPGCSVTPSRVSVRLAADGEPTTATFWVVPQVLGRVSGAAVQIRQDGRTLADVPLDVRVSRQTVALVLGFLSVCMPFLSALARHFKLDLDSQRERGFDVYVWVLRTVFIDLSPVTFALVFAGAAVLAWWLTRPKPRDLFWDVTLKR